MFRRAEPETAPATSASDPSSKRAAGLYTIIAIKAGKGLLLLVLALGVYSLLGDDLRAEFENFLRRIRVDPERAFWVAIGDKLASVTHANLQGFALGFLLYALLLFVESGGLILRAFWAVWMAIGETAFFIPFEVLHIFERPTWLVLGILVVNVLIVVYLVRNRDRLFRHPA